MSKIVVQKYKDVSGVSFFEMPSGSVRLKIGKKVTGGALISKVFKKLEDAKDEAEHWVNHARRRELGAANLSTRDSTDALNALELLVKSGVRHVSLTKLAEDYLARLPAKNAVTAAQACKEYEEWREEKGSGGDYLYSLKAHFKSFIHAYGHLKMTDITEADLKSLTAMWREEVATKTYNNRLTSLKALFKREIKLKRLSEKENPCDELERISNEESEDVSIIDPKDLHKLIKQAIVDDELELALLISLQAFAGLRRSEAMRITWDDIKETSIRLSSSKTKTGRGRSVPILPSLRKVLNKMERPQKAEVTKNSKETPVPILVSKLSDYQYDTRKKKLCTKLEIPMPINVLRHSFVSYRLVATKDASATAYEAGHSEKMQSDVYDGVADEEDAIYYFNIML